MITAEGKSVLVELALSLLLFSTLLYNPVLLLSLAFLTAFFSFYVIGVSRRLESFKHESVEVRRGQEVVEVLRGSRFEVRTTVELDWHGIVEVFDVVPPGIRVVSGSSASRVRCSGRSTVELRYEAAVWSGYRVVRFEGVKLVLHDPLGLVRGTFFVPAPMEVRVPFERARHAGLWTTSMVRLSPGSGTVLNQLIGEDYSFVGVRPFSEGDKVRDVHWRKTAALTDDDALLVKRYERLGRGNVVAVIDCSPEMSFGLANDYLDAVLGAVWMTGKSAIDQGSSFRLVLIRSRGPAVFTCGSVAELSEALAGVDVESGPVTSITEHEVSGALAPGSYVTVYTSPGTRNLTAVMGLISLAARRSCRITVVLPEVRDYGASLDPDVLGALERCAERFVSSLPRGCSVRTIGHAPSPYVIRRTLLHEGG